MLPARRSHAENALDAALERLAPGRVGERPDTPDLHVTALRRLPALAAQYVPFPKPLDRRTIRARAQIVLSNPDMVHSGILPHHPRWAKLFENLRYVVIDELHAYRGVFGSHLCNVLRRLRRICRHYGSNPVFLCSSATI